MIFLLFFAIAQAVDIGKANNQFGFTLYNEVSKVTEDNVIFSPYSMYSVLGLLLGACDGDSRTQLLEALEVDDYSDSETDIHQAISELAKQLDDSESVSVNHGVFIAEMFEVYQTYLDFAEEYYEAFVDDKTFPEPGRTEINDWVEEKTKGMIKDLLPELSPLTRAVLVNTIHFKNSWSENFEKYSTRSHQFSFLGENIKEGSGKTIMMEKYGLEALYGFHSWDSKFESVELQFKNDEEKSSQYGMYILLPEENTKESFRNMEESLKTEAYDDGMITRLQDEQELRNIHLKLPRFEIEWKALLNDYFKEYLGLVDVFDDQKADISKLTDISVHQLYVSMIIQQAKIKVDEDGCEAAAASAVVMNELSMPYNPYKELQYFVDRPFMFLLYHKVSKSVLFMGKVMKPETTDLPIGEYIGVDNEEYYDYNEEYPFYDYYDDSSFLERNFYTIVILLFVISFVIVVGLGIVLIGVIIWYFSGNENGGKENDEVKEVEKDVLDENDEFDTERDSERGREFSSDYTDTLLDTSEN